MPYSVHVRAGHVRAGNVRVGHVKFTVHVVQSFIKGHRKSGVISIKHSRDITHQINPLTVE